MKKFILGFILSGTILFTGCMGYFNKNTARPEITLTLPARQISWDTIKETFPDATDYYLVTQLEGNNINKTYSYYENKNKDTITLSGIKYGTYRLTINMYINMQITVTNADIIYTSTYDYTVLYATYSDNITIDESQKEYDITLKNTPLIPYQSLATEVVTLSNNTIIFPLNFQIYEQDRINIRDYKITLHFGDETSISGSITNTNDLPPNLYDITGYLKIENDNPFQDGNYYDFYATVEYPGKETFTTRKYNLLYLNEEWYLSGIYAKDYKSSKILKTGDMPSTTDFKSIELIYKKNAPNEEAQETKNVPVKYFENLYISQSKTFYNYNGLYYGDIPYSIGYGDYVTDVYIPIEFTLNKDAIFISNNNSEQSISTTEGGTLYIYADLKKITKYTYNETAQSDATGADTSFTSKTIDTIYTITLYKYDSATNQYVKLNDPAPIQTDSSEWEVVTNRGINFDITQDFISANNFKSDDKATFIAEVSTELEGKTYSVKSDPIEVIFTK